MEDVLTCYETNQIPPPADADGVAGRTDAGWKIYQRQTMKLTKQKLRKTQSLDRQTSFKLACLWAEHVLPIYESKYPDDKRPRLAIEAAKAWADNPTDEKLARVKLAADGAWKARRSAYAATAADDAELKWQADKIRELIPCPFENL